MRILFLSYYFEPDLCAGSFRNTALFKALLNQMSRDDSIHVITTKPNRYASYHVIGLSHEEGLNYVIDRIETPQHASGFVDQIKSYFVYFHNCKKITKGKKYDLVYASSSRLMTAFLGKRLSAKNNCPLYLDIRDIFVDGLKRTFKKNKLIQIPLILVLTPIEKYTFRNATHINLVSEGFNYYFSHYPKPNYSYFTNGIDDIFLEAAKEKSQHKVSKPYTIVYAGNIGSGQGLEQVIPEAAQQLGDDYKFLLIGDGTTKALLLKKMDELQVKNVEVLKPVSRTELIDYYKKADYFFFHLNGEQEHLSYVLPSKMFEYGAFDIPIIAGVREYPRHFIETNMTNILLFEPGCAHELVEQIKTYPYKTEKRTIFIEKFARKAIISKMANSILEYNGGIENARDNCKKDARPYGY